MEEDNMVLDAEQANGNDIYDALYRRISGA